MSTAQMDRADEAATEVVGTPRRRSGGSRSSAVGSPGAETVGAAAASSAGAVAAGSAAAAGSTSAAAEPAAAVIELRDAEVRGSRGPVFGPLTVRSDRPVTVVQGSRGTGRTSLLLAIAGRMRPSAGSLVTLGATKPAEIRRRTGIAGFAEIDALEPAVTLGATLRERLAWAMPWYRRTPRMTPVLAGELLGAAFGEYEQPDPATPVRELTPAEEMLVRISLALIEEPELLAIDDFDALRDPAERALVAGRLNDLAARGIRIALATSDPGDLALFAEHRPALISL
ncbi:ATP-binding cassette domain-containing protein [Leucobacter sp.]